MHVIEAHISDSSQR